MAPSQPSNDEIKQPLLQKLPHEGPLTHDEPRPHHLEGPPDYISNCNWFSYFFFQFPFSLMKLGYSRVLQLKDLPPCPAECKSEMLVSRFLNIWEAQKKSGNKQSIVTALAKCFWRDILITAFAALIKGLGVLSGPIFLFFIVEYASGIVRFENEGIVLVVALSVAKILENLGLRHWYFGVRVLGTKVQSAVMAAIYQKVLALSSTGRQRYTSGEIVNFISVDAYRLCELAWRLHWAWLVPALLIGSLATAYAVVGLAMLPALVILVVGLAGLTPLIRSMQLAQRKFMERQDERLRATSEVLQGMKVIKLQAWEEKFNVFIQEKRDLEFEYLAETQQKRNYATIVYWLMPMLLTCVVLLTCLLLQISLTSTLIFTVLAIFRIVQDPVRMTPEVLAAFIQAQISFVRLQNFLQEEELPEEEALYSQSLQSMTSDYVIRVDGACLSWLPDEPQPTLHDLNIVIKRGEKVAVCGSVGSGKSSLLLALCGEMPKLSGSVHVCGNVAYVSQAAWVQSMTVRDNILFGKPFNKAHYERVIQACALEQDMKSFSHGDLTEIGERGTNMSGGQKQRIQLARALYNDADIYLLDDPFSAVDAQTSAHLFHECVMKALRDKTVVLVTHQMEFLPFADSILVMQDGGIKQAGSYSDLLSAGGDVFQKLVSAHEQALHTVIDDKPEKEETVQKEDGPDSQFEKIQKRLSREESLAEIGKQGATTQLVQEEEVMSGKVGLKPYINYIQISRSQLVATVLILSQTIFSGVQLYSNLWLAQGVSNSAVSSVMLVGLYCVLCVVCGLVFALRSQMIVKLGLQASKSFFSKLMECVMKAPMGFFDATPSGRILNRVSVDISVIDLDIPFCYGSLLGTSFDVLCIIVVTCLVTWQLVVVVLPVIGLAQYLQHFYAAAARELNRINATTKAPIVNNSAETLSGGATIRVFRQSERFRRRNLELIDRDASAYIYKFAAIEWMVLRIELSCTLVLTVAASLVLFQSNVSGGFTGLAVTYALALSSSLVIFCIWQGFLAVFIVSVERIKQYLDLPREAPAVIEKIRPPPQWPERGEIFLDHLQIRYRDNSPLVLKGITCTFHGGQRVGVVGRTGSGKTTLISALFRLVEPAHGRICIDGIDICSIGLHDLRFKLGIIPQDPVLFQGTVRTNLDPLNQYTDFDIWEALRKSQLLEVIEKLPLRLESPGKLLLAHMSRTIVLGYVGKEELIEWITEGVGDRGENWSVGQRQLFCLGRVLLKQSRVLVLDEATASIDSATDALLQTVIREEFLACTVITVAHRIPTVIDSDMVLTLSYGEAVEFDSPKRLIDQKTSHFAQLVAEYWAQAGRSSSSH